MPSVDDFFHKHKPQFGSAGTDWDSAVGRCSSCKGLGYPHSMVKVKRAGQLFFTNHYGEHDLGATATPVCSSCGQVNLGVIAYAKGTGAPLRAPLQPNTQPNTQPVTRQGLGALLAKATASYNPYTKVTFKQWGDKISITHKPTCECGAHKTGALNNSPAHSSWCPEYNAAPKAHVETHEELVARVKAGKKGAQSNP